MVVYLVGAGPGDPALITVRGLQLIREAEVLIYDRLVSEDLVRESPPTCERIYVGKREGERPSQEIQAEIHALLVERAGRHRVVVRLKGGDPLVFGRGGEEAEVLRGSGIPFEIVPGVSSPTAAASLAGIPLSHRTVNSVFAVLTGHDAGGGEPPIDWARLPDTLFILMGAEALPRIARRLLDTGRPGTTPVAVVHNVSLPDQRTTTGTLQTAADGDLTADSPSVIIVGGTVALRDGLSWLEEKRGLLKGRRIAITRAEDHQHETQRLLEAWGAAVMDLPLIRIEAAEVRLPAPSSFDAVVFTSLEGVKRVALQVGLKGYLEGKKVFSIGPTTQRILADHAIESLAPSDYSSAGIGDLLNRALAAGTRVVAFRSSAASQELSKAVAQHLEYREVHVYHVHPQPPEVEAFRRAAIIFLFSATGARTLGGLADQINLKGKLLVSIGQSTTAALPPGMTVLTSPVHTGEGMVATLLEHLWRTAAVTGPPPE